jgi:hypothetical protein
VLYELLTGELPGTKLQPPSTRVQIDVRLDEVVLRALAQEPELRYATAHEFKTCLETVATAPVATPTNAAPANNAPAADSARGFARLALALFLAATLGSLLLFTLTARHNYVLIFGVTALVCAAVFGFLSWRNRLGRTIALLACGIPLVFGVLLLAWIGIYQLGQKPRALEQARRMEQEARDQIAAELAANDTRSKAARHFVRLVASPTELTFEGTATTWDDLATLLSKVPDRHRTVLELAAGTDEFPRDELLKLQGRAQALAQQFGFEYLSYVGVHPLGSTGTAVAPRAIVDQWLGNVKANRTASMWDLTTRESGGAGSVDLRNTWPFEKIKAYTLALTSNAAMVVTTRYHDNAGRERMIVFTLVKRDGRWLIRDHAVASPDQAESRLKGFTAASDARFDVRAMDIIGRWIQPFFAPAQTEFKEDGIFSTSFRTVSGQTNLHGRWTLEEDRLSYFTSAGGVTGRVVRVREDFFQMKFADGTLSGFERLPVDTAVERRPLAKRAEFQSIREVTLWPETNGTLSLDDERLYRTAPTNHARVTVSRDDKGQIVVELHNIHNFRLDRADSNREWSETSAEELMQRYREAGFALLPSERYSHTVVTPKHLPVTYLLPGVGLLQITALLEEGRGVRLRYKIVRLLEGSADVEQPAR